MHFHWNREKFLAGATADINQHNSIGSSRASQIYTNWGSRLYGANYFSELTTLSKRLTWNISTISEQIYVHGNEKGFIHQDMINEGWQFLIGISIFLLQIWYSLSFAEIFYLHISEAENT